MSSGSTPSPAAVKPTRSAKMTDTTLRSSPPVSDARGSGGTRVAEPQEGQKRAASGSTVPHNLQRWSSGDPHDAQNRASGAVGAAHEGQAGIAGGCMGGAGRTSAPPGFRV